MSSSTVVVLNRVVPRVRFIAVAAVLALAAVAAFRHFPVASELLLTALFLALTAVGVSTLSWMLHAWRDDASVEASEFERRDVEPALSFSLILPARHEEEVLAATLAQLARQDHPAFEVIVVVGHDDPETHAVAADAIGGDPRFRLVVDTNEPKNKPKALNTALPHCRGDIISVFDAEDVVAPQLLRAVDQTFQSTGAEIVQGATQLVNHHSSWFAVRNALEYYFWFKSRLHFHARTGFIPLGGNTVFVRRGWLVAIGGWDEECLAEDCDLGARLSARGARTVVAYTADLATREETPETLGALIKQRTRWSQGFLQVFRKRDWTSLPIRSRLLAGYTLAFPFLQAASALILPFSVACVLLLNLPIELALLSFVPVVPLIAILGVETVGLRSFAREFRLGTRPRDYVRLVLGAIPYQIVLGIAAARAAWRELRGVRNWEKTAHVGAHL
jgi:cellulose synthase/poly-beta-1,6-N-acetylglucosamine synthase-like glycosyltransferase